MIKRKISENMKIFFLVLYLLISNQNLFNIIFINIGHNDFFKMSFYLIASITFFLIFIYFSFIQNYMIRGLFCIPLLISSFFSELYFSISNQIINIDVIEIALISKGSFLNFYNYYKIEIFDNLTYFFFGLIAVFYPKNKKSNFFNYNKYILSIFIFFYFSGLFSFSIYRGGFGQNGLPSQLTSFIPFSLIKFSQGFHKNNKINYIKDKGNQKSKILIIDESISFKYFNNALRINNLQNVKNKEIFKKVEKFYSLHNCSAQSIWSLMNGLSFNNNGYYIKKNLWQVAKENNFQTIYLSGQENKNKYQYLQKPSDLMFIDKKKFFGNEKNNVRDQLILKELKKSILKEENIKKFIVVLKNGSHYPYINQFNYKKYNLDKNSKLEDLYKFSIKENTINFLDDLFEFIKNKDVEIFYLSDHGQNLKSNELTHCNSENPNINEWEIPLILYNIDRNSKKKLKSNLMLYNLIVHKLGFKIIGEKVDNHHLFFGSLNQRFGKKIKKKEVGNSFK